ncbi:MAG: LCP family protein [Candidatus Saccharimonadia bacterium]
MNKPENSRKRQLDGPIRKRPVQPAVTLERETAVLLPPKNNLQPKPTSSPRTIARILIVLGISLVVLVLYLVIKIFVATNAIITRNTSLEAPALVGTVTPQKLKAEGDGRINILLLGIGGAGHPGGSLSDTMMIVSIDPSSKSVAMLSIPRDLWVQIPGHGYAKINAANAYGGPDLAKSVVSSIFGVPINYYIQLDFAGFRQAVDEVGGIDVVNGNNLSDPNYPCDDESGNICPYYLAAGSYHLDGTQALKYVRCREGTCGTNYGREDRQRQSLLALQKNALALGTITNPVKLSSLIGIVGNHLRTDLNLSDIAKLSSMLSSVTASNVVSSGLEAITTSGWIDGQSVVLPKTGNLLELQTFVHSIFPDSYLTRENAAIALENGSTKDGLEESVGALLKSYNYRVISTSVAKDRNYPATIIYDYTNGAKPYTLNYLENRFGVGAQEATRPSGDAADIRIIIGDNYQPSS